MNEVIHVEGGTIGLMVDFVRPTLNIIVCPENMAENMPAFVWEGCALSPLIVHVSHQLEKFVVHLFRLILSENTWDPFMW